MRSINSSRDWLQSSGTSIIGIRRAPLECEEDPVEKKIRELIEEIVKSMGGDKC